MNKIFYAQRQNSFYWVQILIRHLYFIKLILIIKQIMKQNIVNFGTDYQFNTAEILGKGNNSIIFRAVRINSLQFDTRQLPNKIAIKVIFFGSEEQELQICDQIEAYEYLKSPGIVSIYKYQRINCFGQNAIAIAMQLMQGTLRQILNNQYERKPIPVNKAVEIYYKIITAYQCIYVRSEQKKQHNPGSQDIVHCDIKPQNIFYKYEGDKLIFKIGDFGSIQNYKLSEYMRKSAKCTILYASPQQLSFETVKYTNKADLYATGTILFQLLNGKDMVPLNVQDPESKTCCIYQNRNKKLNQVSTRNVLQKLGVQSDLTEFIINCLKSEEQQRFSWNDVFEHKIFKKYMPMNYRPTPVKITPDITTYAWNNKYYRQDNANKNVCISSVNGLSPQWLCSAQELGRDCYCVFTIKAIKISQYTYREQISSKISIGVMESIMKREERGYTQKNCIYLSLPAQTIWRSNERQTKQEGIDCSCQQSLQLPCLIKCLVNRNQNTITWHYKGKDQAKQSMPKSWKDGRKLCVVVCIWEPNDCVEFM